MNKRIALWDNLKFILIFLVVLGHFAGHYVSDFPTFKSIFIFIYLFHMPLFIFISGYFYNEKNIKSKCFFYISVGFFLKVVLSSIYLLVGEDPNFYLLSDSDLPWYLFVIVIHTLIVYFTKNINKKYLLIASIIIACFAGYDTSIGDYLYISRALIFFPFFLAGTMINDKTIEYIKSKKTFIIISIVTLLTLILVSYFKINDIYIYRHLLTGRNPFSNDVVSYGPIARFICYIIAGMASFSLIVLTPQKQLKFITKFGQKSLDVYFWHWPVFLIIYYLIGFDFLLNAGALGKFIYLSISILFTIVLSFGGIISLPLEKIKQYCYNNNKKKEILISK